MKFNLILNKRCFVWRPVLMHATQVHYDGDVVCPTQVCSCCAGCPSSLSTSSMPSAYVMTCLKPAQSVEWTPCSSPSLCGWDTSTPSSTQSSTPSLTLSSGEPSRSCWRNLAARWQSHPSVC